MRNLLANKTDPDFLQGDRLVLLKDSLCKYLLYIKENIMKLTKIALAVAALLASTQVFAAPVTAAQITAAQSAGTLQQAWISGATAPTKSVYEG